jgi:hypothetical protein
MLQVAATAKLANGIPFAVPFALISGSAVGIGSRHMLESLADLTRRLRRAPRKQRRKADLRIDSVKLSFLDRRFKADAWIVKEAPGRLALRLGDYDLAFIAGNSVDLPSLNQILQRFCHWRPRGQ